MSTATLPELCPACLRELPDGYLYDHVRIDLAAAGRRDLFATMPPLERREVILTALARGVGLLDLAERLEWPYNRLRELLPADHPLSREAENSALEELIRDLWGQGLIDVTISARTGLNPSRIGRIRKRLGLPRRRKGSAHWAEVAAP